MTDRQVELVVYRGDTLLQRISLPHGTLTFGRSEDCDLCLEDISVSRKHGQFTLSNEEILFEDLGSGNGSWFKGQRIRSQLLEDGDEVLIEPFRLQIEALLELNTATDANDENADRTVMLSRTDAQGLLESEYPDARLEVLTGIVNEPFFALEGQLLSLGRSEQRDVILSDKAASRLHCEIVPLKGAYWIRDSGSANGVKVNGSPIAEHELSDGDTISIGETQIRYLCDEVLGSKTDVLGLQTESQSDHTEAFVNVMAPDQGWSLNHDDTPPAEAEQVPQETQPQASPQASPQAPPSFPVEEIGDPDATIEPRDDNAPPIFAPLPNSPPAEPQNMPAFGESDENSIDYGISPELGDSPDGDWGFGGALSNNKDGSLKAQKGPGSGIFGNWVRTTIVSLLICSVGLVLYKKLSDAGIFASAGPQGMSRAIYLDDPTNHLDPNILARTNQLMDEGRQAFSREDYFSAFQKYYEASSIDPSNETARREQVRACEMVAVARLKGKVSSDEATAEQKKEALDEAVSAAETALTKRQNGPKCRQALTLIKKGLDFNPGNTQLEELRGKLNSRLAMLRREGERVTKESIASAMKPLIASGSRNFSGGRYANAISDFQKALDLDPERSNLDLLLQAEEGLERAKNKRRTEARRHYQEAARYFNSSDSADMRRARQALRQALSVDPEYEAAKTKLANIMSELRSRAKEEYDKGKVMLSASQYERARLHFQKVLTLLDDPSDSMYQRAREEINSMGPG